MPIPSNSNVLFRSYGGNSGYTPAESQGSRPGTTNKKLQQTQADVDDVSYFLNDNLLEKIVNTEVQKITN